MRPMRGEDRVSGALVSFVDVEARIPAKHPLRAMRRVTDAALAELDRAFSALYEGCGRPSIPPERLLRAAKLQLLYPIRSERQLGFVKVTAGRLCMAQHAHTPAAIRPRGRATRQPHWRVFVCKPGG